MSQATVLQDLLKSGETLVMPDAYDPLSARLIEYLGFSAVQCSGYSMALASCAPSEYDLGFARNVAITETIVQAVSVPVMADGEDGFGDDSVIPRTIRAYVEAGVAGINLEDQVLGTPGPQRLLAGELAVAKLRAARSAARVAGVPDLVLNARTDALPAGATPEEGLREAIERANLYLAAGADLAFVVGVNTLDQVRVLVREVAGPVSIAAGMPYNWANFSISQLRDCGVARVSLPPLLIYSSVGAMLRRLQSVRDTGGFEGVLAEGIARDVEAITALLAR